MAKKAILLQAEAVDLDWGSRRLERVGKDCSGGQGMRHWQDSRIKAGIGMVVGLSRVCKAVHRRSFHYDSRSIVLD